MDQGLLSSPTLRSFFRFSSRALFIPNSSAPHGFDLGSIQMVNAAYGTATEKVSYAVNGANVLALEEAIMVSPVWKIKGNQFHSRIRSLLLMGTRQTDSTVAANAGSPQTITGAVPGGSYDLGVRGITTFTSLTGPAASPVYINGVDYEVDLSTGMLRIIDGGAITVASNVIATYASPVLVREKYTAFDNINQLGTLKCFSLRTGDSFAAEEATFSGNLYVDNIGDVDPKKHREWTLTFSVSGVPTFIFPKV